MVNLENHLFENKDSRIVDAKTKYQAHTVADTLLQKLNNKTFITPDNLVTIIDNQEDFYKRHNYHFSGRSFWKGYKKWNQDYELVVKWWHIGWNIVNNDIVIREPQCWRFWIPLYGSESINQLTHELDIAKHLQRYRNSKNSKYWPFPIPIQVSTLTHYKVWWNIIDYNSFLAELFFNSEYYKANIFSTIKDCKEYKNLSINDIIKHYEQDINKLISWFLECWWEHGSYIYLVEWTNMRLADVFILWTRDQIIQRIQNIYKEKSNEDICKDFMMRYWSATGSFLGTGICYKNIGKISACHLVDTTILGSIMDIWTYEITNQISWDRIHDMLKHFRSYIEVCYIMYTLLIPNQSYKQFVDFFEKYFIDNYFNSIESFINQEAKDNIKSIFINIFPEISDHFREALGNQENLILDKEYMNNIINMIYHQ